MQTLTMYASIEVCLLLLFYVNQHRYEGVEVPADEIILLLLCLV